MVDKLNEFLRVAADKKFKLGEFDCGLWLADWYMAATGKLDPVADIRGREYVPGDLVKHFVRICRLLNLSSRYDNGCERGDVALVKHGDVIRGAICTGFGWALFGEAGLEMVRPDAVQTLVAFRIV